MFAQSRFKPSTEQVAEALGVTLEELHAGLYRAYSFGYEYTIS